MDGRYICVIIFLNIPAYLFLVIGTLFTKSGYVCNFDNNAIIFKRTNFLLELCALSCMEDKRCFSFQHNKKTQQCFTTTWNIYGVQTWTRASDDNEIVYMKGKTYIYLRCFWGSYSNVCKLDLFKTMRNAEEEWIHRVLTI